MMGWQWYQLDRMQIIYTSLQTDNHASTSQSPLSFYRPHVPTNSVKALKATYIQGLAEIKATVRENMLIISQGNCTATC